MFRTSALFFVAFVIALVVSLELEEGKPYMIVNAADRSYLNVVTKRNLCQPHSAVTTVASPDDSEGVVWNPNWRGDLELFGVLFDTVRSVNPITFEAGPTCFPVYNQYDLIDVASSGAGVLIRERWMRKCVTGNGVDMLVDFQECAETNLNQIWYFKHV